MYEYKEPRVKITIIPIALPIIAAVSACDAVMPTSNEEKTPIASLIPKPPGVIARTEPRVPIAVKNKAFENEI